jgi:hypothetical protein
MFVITTASTTLLANVITVVLRQGHASKCVCSRMKKMKKKIPPALEAGDQSSCDIELAQDTLQAGATETGDAAIWNQGRPLRM